MINFKPMLAVMWDKNNCSFPKYASTKLDGIRAVFKDGQLLSRSLKPIRNIQIQKKFCKVIDYAKMNNIILDGEFYSHEKTFQEISSIVNSSNKAVPSDIEFHCFDVVFEEEYNMCFVHRYEYIKSIISSLPNVIAVKQIEVKSYEEVNELFEKKLEEGYEGLILRDTLGKYKCGRSTVNEALLLKVKPFETFDLPITGVLERMKNINEKQTNELGRSFRSNTKEGKESTGIAACFTTIYNGHKMSVTLTGEESFRREIWNNKDNYKGLIMEVKGMLIGAKDVLRHPTFIRFRGDKK